MVGLVPARGPLALIRADPAAVQDETLLLLQENNYRLRLPSAEPQYEVWELPLVNMIDFGRPDAIRTATNRGRARAIPHPPEK